MAPFLQRLGYAAASRLYWSYGSYLSTRAASKRGVRLGRSPVWGRRSRYRSKWVEEAAVCESDQPIVALTFDDGPTPGVTDKILTILKEHEAQATFFVIGRKIPVGVDLISRSVEEGHRVGNHTFNHRYLPSAGKFDLLEQVRNTQHALLELTGRRARWFRPPYGALRTSQEKYVVGEGLQLAYWSVNSKDWRRPGVPEIFGKVKRELHAGAVIVMHDVHEQTVQALPYVLDEINRRGWRSVTLSEMFPRPAVTSR